MKDSLLCNPHISQYICSLEPDLPDVLQEIYDHAVETKVPVIRKEAQGLLRFLHKSKNYKRILEIGTAVGFSGCFQFECSCGDADLYTIEKVPARIEVAKPNIERYLADFRVRNGESRGDITLLCGDAAEILEELVTKGEQFDFIFLDAAKAQYPVYLESIRKLLTVGGTLVTDNVLQEGSLAESKFTVTRRDRTIHLRMREYIQELFREEAFTSVMLPLGDGMTISTKLV